MMWQVLGQFSILDLPSPECAHAQEYTPVPVTVGILAPSSKCMERTVILGSEDRLHTVTREVA